MYEFLGNTVVYLRVAEHLDTAIFNEQILCSLCVGAQRQEDVLY